MEKENELSVCDKVKDFELNTCSYCKKEIDLTQKEGKDGFLSVCDYDRVLRKYVFYHGSCYERKKKIKELNENTNKNKRLINDIIDKVHSAYYGDEKAFLVLSWDEVQVLYDYFVDVSDFEVD